MARVLEFFSIIYFQISFKLNPYSTLIVILHFEDSARKADLMLDLGLRSSIVLFQLEFFF